MLTSVALVVALAGAASAAVANPRIVGGTGASIERFPWQVSIQVGRLHHCGGSIITKSCVLTAAHCVEKPAYIYEIRAGSSFASKGGRVYDVIEKKVHEHYNRPLYSNDVAILKIRKEFELGDKVQIVPLATSRPEPGTSVTVSGWGSTSEHSDTAERLRACTVKVIAMSECRSCYADETLTESMMCAGMPSGGKDACQGDSGGPLVRDAQQVGVVSFGKGCARPNLPGIYADVVSLRAWITRNADMPITDPEYQRSSIDNSYLQHSAT